MPVRVVLFDMDDTLTNWPAAIDAAIATSLGETDLAGEPLASRSLWEEIRAFTWIRRDGVVVNRAHWRLLYEPQVPWERAFPGMSQRQRAAAVDRFRECLRPPLFEDVPPVLDALAERYHLGVLTNSPIARQTLSRVGVLDRFATVFMADDPYRKPHPRAFESALAEIPAGPGETLFVGDSLEDDVDGALRAGIAHVAWIDRFNDGSVPPAPALHIRSLADILPFLAAGAR